MFLFKSGEQTDRQQRVPVQYIARIHSIHFCHMRIVFPPRHTLVSTGLNYKIECMYCLMPQSPEIKWLSFFLLLFSFNFWGLSITHMCAWMCVCVCSASKYLYRFMLWTCFKRTCTASFATGQQNPYLKLFNRCFGIIHSLCVRAIQCG